MSKLRFTISMSPDGSVAGPNQSVANPLGVGGRRLHEWAFELAIFRALHGTDGGVVNESTPVVEEALANIGATAWMRWPSISCRPFWAAASACSMASATTSTALNWCEPLRRLT